MMASGFKWHNNTILSYLFSLWFLSLSLSSSLHIIHGTPSFQILIYFYPPLMLIMVYFPFIAVLLIVFLLFNIRNIAILYNV